MTGRTQVAAAGFISAGAIAAAATNHPGIALVLAAIAVVLALAVLRHLAS